MTTETPAQRRTRLIEQYVAQLHPHICHCKATIDDATRLADAVIAATPQEPPTRYPSEAETRLIELVESQRQLLLRWGYAERAQSLANDLAAIKRDLGLV